MRRPKEGRRSKSEPRALACFSLFEFGSSFGLRISASPSKQLGLALAQVFFDSLSFAQQVRSLLIRGLDKFLQGFHRLLELFGKFSVLLVLPGVTGLAPALTPLAAFCLAMLMVGAVKTHRRLGERVLPAVVVGGLCLLVAVAHSVPPA